MTYIVKNRFRWGSGRLKTTLTVNPKEKHGLLAKISTQVMGHQMTALERVMVTGGTGGRSFCGIATTKQYNEQH